MLRTRKPARLTRRKAVRLARRPLGRACVRSLPGSRRPPDPLSQALTAFARALRCHERLAKLAPSFFDATVVDRETRERAERRRWMESWQPAFEKVYGPDAVAGLSQRQEPESPPLPGSRRQRVVERKLAELDLWLTTGHLAWDRHQQRSPQARVTITPSQVARLIRIASRFGHLACGSDPHPAEPTVSSYALAFEADFKRAYGNPECH